MSNYQVVPPSPEQVARDPELFAAVFLRILDKKSRIVPFVWNAAQKDFNTKRTRRNLVLKARQLGLSTAIQGEMFRRTVTSTRSTITLAHDTDTTTKLRLMADRFYDNCVFDGIQPARKYANASLTTYPELNSVATIATAGTVETGRGGTYTDMHGSEVAFWKDAEKIVAGAMQGGDPDVTLESTPNGTQGYFYELCMEALHENNNGIWKLHFYPWWWDPEYKTPLEEGEIVVPDDEEQELILKHSLSPEQIKWRRTKKKELKRLFSQEYPEDPVSCFLTSGQGYFGDLTDVFTAPMEAAYVEGHKYGAGLDFGQTDYTAMPVLDFTTKRQVDLLHVNGKSWGAIRSDVKRMVKKWHLDSILAEKNSIGAVNIEELIKMGVHVLMFETTNQSKSDLMSDLNEALHDGGWKLQPHLVQKNEFSTFVAIQSPSTGIWRLAAAGDGHDDTVMGCGLAYRSGRYTVTDEELENYGKGTVQAADIDEDMVEYMAINRGISVEQAREIMMKGG